MTTVSHDEIKAQSIAAGVVAAQDAARREGFRWGDIVTHPSLERACQLRGIVGDTAYLFDAVDGMIEVPADEIFDPNVAHSAAVSAALAATVCPN